jgi:hypothetical protein
MRCGRLLTDKNVSRLSTLFGRCAIHEPDIQPRRTRNARLLNHLVRADEQRLRDGDVERFGGLEVDDEIELGRLLDR